MSILIEGMDMPLVAYKEIHGTLWKDGRFSLEDENTISTYKAIKIPTPHGRLIDADELIELYDDDEWEDHVVPIEVVRQNIKDTPTVIEAEGE